MVAKMSALQLAKRARVTLLLALARQYNIVLALNRDSKDDVVLTAFKKVARKVQKDYGQAKSGETTMKITQRRSNSFCELCGSHPPSHPLESSMVVEAAGPLLYLLGF